MSWLDRLYSRFRRRSAVKYASQVGPVAPFDAAELVLLHNVERVSRGLRILAAPPGLEALAGNRAYNAALAGRTAENLHDGFAAVPWAAKTGENAAMGQCEAPSAMASWMAGPDHRANILDPRFTAMGAGRRTSTEGITYWFAVFTG